MALESKKKVLVVGAGFAGATYARLLAEAGHAVEVIDRRGHIAGNAYDRIDANANRVHVYGPHLFHTNNPRVVDWLSRFTDWVDYRHRGAAVLPDGRFCPLPINRITLETVFDCKLDGKAAAEALLKKVAEPVGRPRNAAEFLHGKIGRRLTDLFYRPYSRKMWGFELENLDKSVVGRLATRVSDSADYFPNDRYQMLPRAGYTALFEAMLDHPGINLSLNTPFDKTTERGFDFVFASMSIDEYHEFCEGPLPYRSLIFHHRSEGSIPSAVPAPVVNFTDDGPYTRQIYWGLLPGHGNGEAGPVTVTKEQPCDYADNGFERYYPLKQVDGRPDELYRRYRAMGEKRRGRIKFIGRCGTYQYLDMHQVVSQSLSGAEKWLRETP